MIIEDTKDIYRMINNEVRNNCTEMQFSQTRVEYILHQIAASNRKPKQKTRKSLYLAI